ncbi:hypothetical protein [Vibrio owensii]|uniref:hypothetical protein n=1 Tax=Vibrio harveyi group TaxID=717610 RepID=UPI003CC62959
MTAAAVYSLNNEETMQKYAEQVGELQLLIELNSSIPNCWLGLGSLRLHKGDKTVIVDTNGYNYTEDSEQNQYFIVIDLDKNFNFVGSMFSDESFNLNLDDIFSPETVAELVIEEGDIAESHIASMTLNKGEKFINVSQW